MINLRTASEIDAIRRAGIIAAGALEKIKGKLRAGVSTLELDECLKDFITQQGGVCAFFGYRGYPKNSCVSVNEEVVHGIPSDEKMLRDGDIVSVDIGVGVDGYFADTAATYPVGRVSPGDKKLIEATKKALDLGIKEARQGNHLSDISCVIQRYIEGKGFSVVRDFAGHGIGSQIHEEPEIPNFGRAGCGIKLKSGMILAIEPMVNMGTWQVEITANGWTAVTKDKTRSAHFEHTVAVLDSGPQVLTKL